MSTTYDRFASSQDMVIAQGRRVYKVTPSDTQGLHEVTKSLHILTDGNIMVEPAEGYFDADGTTPVTGGVLRAVVSGQNFDEFRVKQVYATGTTATMEAVC